METIKLFILSFLLLPGTGLCAVYQDSYGNKLELKKKPERIIALGPGAARLAAYLGEIKKLVATENIEVKYPEGRPYAWAYKNDFAELPIVSEGGPDKAPDYERIISLKPDLIILCSLDQALSSSIASKTGVPVFNADYGNLGSFETGKFKKVIETLGHILNAEKRADFLNKKIDSYVSDLKKRSRREKNPSVYAGGLGFKGSQGILITQFAYEPFALLGIKSVIDNGEKARHIFIEKEKLASLNPGHIFIDSGGIDLFLLDYAQNGGFYKMLDAFSKENVYTTLPYNHYTTNVEIVFINAYFIGKKLFPDRFKDIIIDKKAAEIIRDFVGKDVYPDFTVEKRFFRRVRQDNGIFFE